MHGLQQVEAKIGLFQCRGPNQDYLVNIYVQWDFYWSFNSNAFKKYFGEGGLQKGSLAFLPFLSSFFGQRDWEYQT